MFIWIRALFFIVMKDTNVILIELPDDVVRLLQARGRGKRKGGCYE